MKENFDLKNNTLYTIEGVEVFASGKWNGDDYTIKDLDIMVEAFNETKDKIKPFAKLGHDDGQFLAQQDGFPAVGWICNLYRNGSKLLADFCDIPEKIYQLIQNKAYRRVSSEIYWNMKLGEKTYKRLLAAVAFLGGDTPAVTSLNDILSLYGLNPDNLVKYETETDKHVYDFDLQGENMEELKVKLEEMEKENQELKTYKESKEKEIAELSEKAENFSKEIEELKKYREEAEAEKVLLEEEKKKAELQSFLNALDAELLITKASRVYVEELLSQEKKQYTINEQELSKNDLIKQIFQLHKEAFSSVNLEENSQNKPKDEEKDIETLTKEYMEKNQCSEREALKALIK